MQQERCMELLNQIVRQVSDANNTNDTIRRLLLMGFRPDELVDVFGFDRNDVEKAELEYYDD